MPNGVDVNRFSVTMGDTSEEETTTSIGVQSLLDNTAYETAKGAFLSDFVAAFTNGNLMRESATLKKVSTNQYPDNNSQREYKVLVRVEDDVTMDVYTFTLGTFDISAITIVPNTDLVDLTVAPAPAAVAAIEGFYATPRGNAATVLAMEIVGRNL